VAKSAAREFVSVAMRKSLLISPFGVGMLAFLVSLVVVNILLGPETCSDGWQSPSIGSQGACSWHGGVDQIRSPLVFLVSVFVGVIASKVACKLL
jgi:hypothetical protein